MDLALTMGRTASDLRRDMSEVELFDWGRYAAQKGLPWARVEKLLARILMILDLVHMKAPGTTASLADYIPGNEPSQREMVARAMADDAGVIKG